MGKINTDKQKIETLLTRGVEEVIVKEDLEKALFSGKQLRVKLGIDPTAPDLHLGHAIQLRKLQQFQKLGHTAVLIIGDFTARIGDPSERSQERKLITEKEVKGNMKKYLKVAGKILDIDALEVVYNSKWFAKEGLKEIIALAGAGSIQQVLHRADFKKRIEQGGDITLLELLYPLFQGYDSVKVKADVEIGGTDQLFNLLMGRRVQRHFKLIEQNILTTTLLVGLDGEKKMSKSLNNYIALDEKPGVMFGKVMSLGDELLKKYFLLCTEMHEREIETALNQGPRDAKLLLARALVSMYHTEPAAKKAHDEFISMFSDKKKPKEIQSIHLPLKSYSLVELLIAVNFAESKSEARRLIEQGGVRINDEKKNEVSEIISLEKEVLIQVGPRRFVRVRSKN